MKHYACAMRDVVKKMAWRTISLVLSADYEGRVFAEEIIRYSQEEKWDIVHTVWILKSQGNSTDLKSMIEDDCDVVIVHVRGSPNDDLFRLVRMLGVNHFKGAWLLTDITTSEASSTNDLPSGFVRISPRSNSEFQMTEHSLYDGFQLIELSSTDAVKMSRDSIDFFQSTNEDNKALQWLMVK